MLHVALHLVVHRELLVVHRMSRVGHAYVRCQNYHTGASVAGVGGWPAAHRRHAGGRASQVHAAQHGQAPCLAVPELGSYASSGRAWQLWVALLGGGGTGRTGTASGVFEPAASRRPTPPIRLPLDIQVARGRFRGVAPSAAALLQAIPPPAFGAGRFIVCRNRLLRREWARDSPPRQLPRQVVVTR